MGIHDTPNVGGSRNLEEFERHLDHLDPKWVIGIMPGSEWYQSAENIGVAPITRLILPLNRFDERLLKRMLANVSPQSIVIPFNEPNLLGETGTPLLPQVHARELILAAELIANQGCTTLITPLAQEGLLITAPGIKLYEAEYFEQMIAELRNLKSSAWIREHMALAFHNYHLKYNINQGTEPMSRLSSYYFDIIVPALGELDIFITEGGYFLADSPTIDYHAVAEDTRSLLGTELPSNLSGRIKMWALWVYSNLFQRPADDKLDSEAQRLERTALWQLSGPTPIYHAIVEYGRQQKPIATAGGGGAEPVGNW